MWSCYYVIEQQGKTMVRGEVRGQDEEARGGLRSAFNILQQNSSSVFLPFFVSSLHCLLFLTAELLWRERQHILALTVRNLLEEDRRMQRKCGDNLTEAGLLYFWGTGSAPGMMRPLAPRYFLFSGASLQALHGVESSSLLLPPTGHTCHTALPFASS